LVVRGVQALVDDRRALGRVGGCFGVGGIGGPPVDPGQRGRPVPGHRPDGVTQPGQVRREGVADLAGAEHDVEPVVAHELVLADSEQPGRRRQRDLDACDRRYAGPRKQAIYFLKYPA